MVHFMGEMASTYRFGESSRSGSSNGDPNHVPRLGGVRCYWALLQPRYSESSSQLDLSFVHMDPVLGAHLAKQKMSLMGRGIMEFIHPFEREQARRDLTSAIAANDLQGSVTRVRFARLSRIKIILGCPPEEMDLPDAVQKVVEDDEYLVLDIVINWAADGLLLAFFHAIKDMDPIANNDPARAHEGWSNFCRTIHMSDEAIHSMSEGISLTVRLPSRQRYPPTRVFQLYSSSPSQLLYSWPPPRPPGDPGKLDGLYNAAEYIELMAGVDMDPSALPHPPGEVRTTCSTRYGAKHSMTSEGVYRLVESVFIPYGDIVFACFQTTKVFELSPRSSLVDYGQGQAQIQMVGQVHGHGQGQAGDRSRTPTATYRHPESTLNGFPHTPYGNGNGNGGIHGPPTSISAPLLSVNSSGSASAASPPPLMTGPPYDEKPRIGADGFIEPAYPHERRAMQMPAATPIKAISGAEYKPQIHPHSDPLPHAHAHAHPQYMTGTAGHPTYPAPPPPNSSHGLLSSSQASSPHQPPPPTGSRPYPLFSLPPPPGMQDASHQPRHPLPAPPVLQPPLPLPNGLPHPHSHSLRPGSGHGPGHGLFLQHPHGHPQMHPPPIPMDESPPSHIGGTQAPTSRPLIRPPDGVECCVMCGTRESPEWRRNETGIKDLCNACGLRLARQINKRNGKQKPRKKKVATAASAA